ncbi:MAG: hypothetical protein QF815_00110 [Candidatus Peribacteraceae bacterium]|jgi:hypothetical protein|nr:hypothetical protein [Candidatus Peribacteraceae bacterium]MDP7477073.1 hypothetical protein [Candidatus Peribacteraceae bacterium]
MTGIGMPANGDLYYELYQSHFARLVNDGRETNISLGSANPEPIIQLQTREEVEELLTVGHISGDPEVHLRWGQRVTRGHEAQFPEFWGAEAEVILN